MVRVKLERFHQGIAKNSTFNIEDLIPYRGSIPSPTQEDFVETGTTPANDSDSFSVSEFPDVIPLPPPSKSLQKDLVADILDDNVVLTRHDQILTSLGFQRRTWSGLILTFWSNARALSHRSRALLSQGELMRTSLTTPLAFSFLFPIWLFSRFSIKRSDQTTVPSHVVHMFSFNRNLDGMNEELTSGKLSKRISLSR
ncbi:hypothetical protein DVH24_013478 [Malus domestica]|uniref:Uncharacterized protein n=1 Tax=Malus domestica TaxID=3750 RepID=A0A498HLF6_MALDO|nr:hypothetical protein DVH24_013478 [Malus domestica]